MSDNQRGSRAGSWFGPYRLLRLLGRGGMGEVYEAEDTRKRRVVALKLISDHISGDPRSRERMEREAGTAGRLTEPHVVPIHDYGDIDGQFYVDMRLIDGVSLRTILRRDGPLTPARTVAIVCQIAAALDAAHAAGVTHRDVKPENILITGHDFAYLVDFGIARAATDPGLTQTGIAVGTYNYMAPERFTGDEVTYRADIYSLACVLAECLTGSPPYQATSIERMVAAHLMQPPPRPSQLRPGKVPAALDQVIAKGMAKNPEERYRSAGDLAIATHDALTAAEQHQAAAILQQGEIATLSEDAADMGLAGAEDLTQARAWSRTSNPSSARRGWTPSAPSPASPAGPPANSWPQRAQEPDFAPGAPPGRDFRKLWILGGVALLVVAAVSVAGYLVIRGPHSSTSGSGQTELPITGIDFRLSPGGVALDNAGNVYITSESMYGRVVKLEPSSNTPTVLPFAGLYQPQGLAVDDNGTTYVADFNNRVLKLAPGSNNQAKLPFTGLNYPEGVAVDRGGNVYVADRGSNRVVKLDGSTNKQTVLPFSGLNHPDGVAVDSAGTVYVTDTDNNRVLKLDPGSNNQIVLSFTGISVPWGIAVDTGGIVYITEHDDNRVLKLDPGSNQQTVLPFSGLNTPLAVAVDTGGKNVYVADRGNDRVVKLAVR